MKLGLFLSTLLAVRSDCISDSTASNCKDFQLPLGSIESDVAKLCKSMPHMPGCVLDNECNEKSNIKPEPFCNKFSILADICAKDMPKMPGCENYVALCNKPGSVVEQCTAFKPLEHLPTTNEALKSVASICSEMDMDGCEKCAGSKSNSCDGVAVYSQLCKAMPDMSQCEQWNSLCPGSKAGAPQNNLPFCAVDSGDAPPQMRMYFHTGLADYILFKEWVPRTGPQYAGSVIAIIIMGIFYELVLTVRGHLEKGWTAQSSSKLGEYSFRQFQIDSMRGCFQFVESTIAYLLMLISMTFNVGIFFAVIAGIGLGTLIFSRFRAYGSTKRPCGC